MLNFFKGLSLVFIFFSFLFSACKDEIVPEEFLPTETHQDYINALYKLNLNQSALGIDWINASEKALTDPLEIASPYEESFFFNPSKANYIGYLISAKKGQNVEINISKTSNDSIKLFLDVYRQDEENKDTYTHIASNHESGLTLEFLANKDAKYVVRFQTEILRGGNFKINIQTSPSLAFPVVGKGNRAIGSLFGVPRDGGRRKHHGIDIFARRHTPIIAPSDGYVRFAGEKGLGGTVVWMQDETFDQTIYFAHLEDLYVSDGQNINKGDTVGTVGNSGNARTTSPHLHFGIYKNGPIDPYPFVAKTRTKLRRELADKTLIGQHVRAPKDVKFKQNGITKNASSIVLNKHQILEVLGVAASYYRVQLPNEEIGFIDYQSITTLDKPLGKMHTETPISLLNQPNTHGSIGHEEPAGSQLSILGISDEYQLVENTDGIQGWILKT